MKILIRYILFGIIWYGKPTICTAQTYRKDYPIYSSDSLYYLTSKGAKNAINTFFELNECRGVNQELKKIIIKKDSIIDFRTSQNTATNENNLKLILTNGNLKIKAVKRGFWVGLLGSIILFENILILRK